MEEKMVQIGVTALRSPTGEFLPAVPIYIKAEDAEEFNPNTGRTVAEDLALDDVAAVFADKFKIYAEEMKKCKPRGGKTAKKG